MEYKPTIGLEVHAELKTQTKMFCDSKNDPNEKRPNVNICPVCMGHPGTLPTINKEAVKQVLKIGVAVDGKLADKTIFDRKNYFYPDLPKGYQISQYQHPLVQGGVLSGIQLTRIHLEEDTARSFHEEGNYSLIDFNRAGVPLMELVTEPVIHSAREAVAFARELQLLLRYLNVGDAHMEKGEMRVEANISVSTTEKFGTKVEVKNLNSFRAVERAIAFEINRQSKVLEQGNSVTQETRGWDESKQETYSQRLKEESHDYRYFPEPDLPPLEISKIDEFRKMYIADSLPILPWAKRQQYRELYSLDDKTIEILIQERPLQRLFDGAVGGSDNRGIAKLASGYITSDLMGLSRDAEIVGSIENMDPIALRELFGMLQKAVLSSRGAKDILKEMYISGGEPGQIAEKLGVLLTKDENFLMRIVEQVLSENENVVISYKKGKTSALKFLLGMAIKKSGGTGDPILLEQMIKKKTQCID